jgi:lysophospholipase L1-like esterase
MTRVSEVTPMIFERLCKVAIASTATVVLGLVAIDGEAEPAANVSQDKHTPIRIVLAGDSTVTDEEGWGVGFMNCLNKDVECLNLAVGGRSSKSFINEGLWQKCLDAKPDYILVQFGHNDKPGAGAYRETDLPTYRGFMTQYVDEAREAGIKPVLVTPLGQREWGDDGKIHASLQGYVDVVKQIASEKQVALVDLHARSIELYEKLGKDGCIALSPTSGDNVDISHVNAHGSDLIGRIVFAELTAAVPELTKAAAEPKTKN